MKQPLFQVTGKIEYSFFKYIYISQQIFPDTQLPLYLLVDPVITGYTNIN